MRHDFTWLRPEALRRTPARRATPSRWPQEAFEVFYRARNEVVLYDDVLPSLERLQGLTGCSPQQRQCRPRCDRPRADSSSSLAARDAGMLKPDPRIFVILLAAGLAAGDELTRRRRRRGGRRGRPPRRRAAGVGQPCRGGVAVAVRPAPAFVVAGLDELPDGAGDCSRPGTERLLAVLLLFHLAL